MSDWKETCAKCMDGDIGRAIANTTASQTPSYGQHPTTEKSSAVGNAAAMLEALIWMKERIIAAIQDGAMDCTEVLNKIEDALKKPARNCAVGTPQEQEARWNDYCDDVTRGDCPPSAGCKSCALYWAQMPYIKEGGKV